MVKSKTLQIIKYPNEILRQKAESIQKTDKNAIKTLVEMRNYVLNPENNALGLALPQVGISKRGFVATLQNNVEIIINPRIINKSGVLYGPEGCLSIDEQINANIPRAEQITVLYCDKDFKVKKRTLKGLSARVFQHELDHLNGILFIDYLKED